MPGPGWAQGAVSLHGQKLDHLWPGKLSTGGLEPTVPPGEADGNAA